MRTNTKILLAGYVFVFILLCTASFISYKVGIPISDFTRDPAAITGTSPLIGYLSHVGILFWCACAAICFFSSISVHYKQKKSMLRLPLFYAGLITLILLLDDLFLVHDDIFPSHLHLREGVVIPLYAFMIVVYLGKFKHLILKNNPFMLLIAFGFFCLSLIFDIFDPDPHSWYLIFEDGFKLFGIISWFTYFACFSFNAINEAER